jgi:hypothetical protein
MRLYAVIAVMSDGRELDRGHLRVLDACDIRRGPPTGQFWGRITGSPSRTARYAPASLIEKENLDLRPRFDSGERTLARALFPPPDGMQARSLGAPRCMRLRWIGPTDKLRRNPARVRAFVDFD